MLTYAKYITLTTFLTLFSIICTGQGPDIWIFGRNAGLNFTSGTALPISANIDNCYSPSSIQCDETGNLLFYCDGRSIKDRDGTIMNNSANPVWASPHVVMEIHSNIVPVVGDANRYYVFTISPSSGIPPFGSYYSGVLTYSIVDMQLNNGKGDVDPNYSNILLDTNVSRCMLVVPGRECNYWLIVGRSADQTRQAHFKSYKISAGGIEQPVRSEIDVDTLAKYEGFREFDMLYSYKYKKIIQQYGAQRVVVHHFDPGTGLLSNGNTILNLSSEFINPGGGVTFPSLCLSSEEQYLYLLGYLNGIILRQYPINLENSIASLGVPTAIFQTSSTEFQVPSPGISLPYYSQDCDIRLGPDKKIYLFFNTGQSFLGQINNPDAAGMACNFASQGVQLLPQTFSSLFFPSIENKRLKIKSESRVHDTLLCFTEPFLLKPTISEADNYSFVWSNGSTASSILVSEEGTYWARSYGDCNETQYIDTFHVRFQTPEQCSCKIFVPNAFSPNNDLLNDVFNPIVPTVCISGFYAFKIYNRWGQLIYQSNNILKGWDGKVKGQAADLGTYFYSISYTDFKGASQTKKGDFVLLR